jgi:hypothetical protein
MHRSLGFRLSRGGAITALLIGLLIFPISAEAQCAMCRAVLESEGNTSVAEGVNNGIVYLMAIPYVLIAVLFYFVFRAKKA